MAHSILRRMKMMTFRSILRSFLVIEGVLLLFIPFTVFGEALVFATADTPPYVTDRGDRFYDRLMERLASEVDREIRVVRLPSERSLLAAAAGRVDGEFGRIAGLEERYRELRRVPVPLASWEFVAYSGLPAPPRIEGFNTLENRRVAYIDGWKIFEENVHSTAYTLRFTDETQLFQALLSGRVELVLYSAARGNAWIRRNPTREIYRAPGVLAAREMYLYLHESREELIPEVAEALERIRQSSWYSQLEQQYLGREE